MRNSFAIFSARFYAPEETLLGMSRASIVDEPFPRSLMAAEFRFLPNALLVEIILNLRRESCGTLF